jgi:hypothetical protein
MSVQLTVSELEPAYPAASVAVTVMIFAPVARGTEAAFQLVAPVQEPPPPRSLDQVTEVTPKLSEALPLMLSVRVVAEYVPLVVGLVI